MRLLLWFLVSCAAAPLMAQSDPWVGVYDCPSSGLTNHTYTVTIHGKTGDPSGLPGLTMYDVEIVGGGRTYFGYGYANGQAMWIGPIGSTESGELTVLTVFYLQKSTEHVDTGQWISSWPSEFPDGGTWVKTGDG